MATGVGVIAVASEYTFIDTDVDWAMMDVWSLKVWKLEDEEVTKLNDSEK